MGALAFKEFNLARLQKLSNISWKQPLVDRKKEFHLWSSHNDVAKYCNFKDGTKRLLSIEFECNSDLNVIDRFQITSGKEISFPKSFQGLVKPVILGNPNSNFIVKVLDANENGGFEELPTIGSATIKTRIGQAGFRKNLISYWDGKCAVTGVSLESILMASHIKPWAESSDAERLDKYNGFLLSPTIDSIFDKGLITFSKSGKIKFSTQIEPFLNQLGLKKSMSINLADKHEKYLVYYRDSVFKKS